MDEKLFLEAREAIAKIDAEMAALFCKRMQAVECIAAYKREQGLPVFDGQRELALIERNCALIEDEQYSAYYLRFLQHNMQLSREYQLSILGADAVMDAALTEGDTSI